MIDQVSRTIQSSSGSYCTCSSGEEEELKKFFRFQMTTRLYNFFIIKIVTQNAVTSTLIIDKITNEWYNGTS